MIILNRLFNYLKLIVIFLIFELFISFISSLLNLIGLNTGITTITVFIFNILLFFILGYKNSKLYLKKGYLEGILLGFILIIVMFLLKIILFDSNFQTSTFIYYAILLIITTLGGMIGINKKEAN